jgi:hypothetical protein
MFWISDPFLYAGGYWPLFIFHLPNWSFLKLRLAPFETRERYFALGDSHYAKQRAGHMDFFSNVRMAPLAYPVHHRPMGEGRLIRVSKYRGDPQAIAYLVAVQDKIEAMELIRAKAASGDEIEDMGRVSEALIAAMSLAPRAFMPIDGVRHVAQQQQQPQALDPAEKDK